MLTRKQHELLHYINERLEASGISPSFEEMKEALGLRSKSGIHRLITGLEERGFIRRLPHRARALEVIKLPTEAAAPGTRATPFAPKVVRGDFATVAGRSASPESIDLPLVGRIAAGTPIEALQDNTHFVDVPASMINKGEHYALEVAGDSMIDAGILDGDIAVIQRCDTADNGAIVVALVRLGNLLSIQPGPGGLAFAGVVVPTMLAAMSFDPRLIWDQQQRRNHDPTLFPRSH